MLNAYFDETGHSRDLPQRFNGMAGIAAPADHWEVFEKKWKSTLKEFHIPYFHMKDFAHSLNVFEDWKGKESKRRKLLGKLWAHIESTYSMPVGASIPMDAFRSFTEEQQKLFIDPYYLGFLSVMGFLTGFMEHVGLASSEKVALIFSDQVEFKGRARTIYADATKTLQDSLSMQNATRVMKSRTLTPIFQDMRKVVALQAADIAAYEVFKEHERLLGYRQADSPRYGYQRMMEMSNRLGYEQPLIKFYTKDDLAEFIKDMEASERRKAYWKKRRTAS